MRYIQGGANKKVYKVCLFILFCISSGMAWGVSPPSAPSTSTGNYTVTFNYAYDITYLEEKVGASGTWVPVEESSYSNVVNFTNKPSGVYYYRVVAVRMELECGPYECSGFNTYEYYSSAVSVTVTSGPPPEYDNLEEQLTYQYQIRRGDINGDGRQDFYLKRASGGNADNGVLFETIVQQLNNGAFSVYPANSSQLASASYWPLISTDLVLRDFNLDGYVDVVTQGLGSSFSGVDEQVVFSSGAAYSRQAQRVTAADDEFKKFFRDVRNWMADPDYFDQATAPQIGYQVKINRVAQYCDYYGCTEPAPYLQPINLGTYTLGELGVTSPLDTTSDYITARQNIAQDAEDVDCFYVDFDCDPWCGTDFRSYGSGYLIIYWDDVWTQTTVSGGFDSVNFSEDAYIFSETLESGLYGEPLTESEATEAKEITESILGVALGETLGGVLGNLEPLPEVQPETTPRPQPRPLPEGYPEAANDPNWWPRSNNWEWVKIVLRRGPIVICAIFCSAEGEDDAELIWFEQGIDWALQDLEDEDIEQDDEIRVVIGEGDSPYIRIPRAAQRHTALWYNPGEDFRTPGTPYTNQDLRYMWKMNAGWIYLMRGRNAIFYDIGLYEGREDRGAFYPCERAMLNTYPHRIEDWAGGDTLGFDVGPCNFSDF